MSSLTPRLNLVKPALSDEVHQTILDLANNFQILDDNADIYMNNIPTSGTWNKKQRIYNSNPDIGQYIGWVCVRSGVAAPIWTSLTVFQTGDLIIPTVDNGHYYVCIQSGRSGVLEPVFPTTSGAVVQDIQGATVWQPSKTYQLNDIVIPSVSNNRFYLCTVAGVSGTTEPSWSLVDGQAVSDGSVVWVGYRIVSWKEQGVSAKFRPFGKID